MAQRRRVSAAEARRIVLGAQGFDRPRPASATDVRHFRRALAAIAVLQLDFVNVLIPAHFLMIWSRLGAYDRKKFEHYLYHSGEHTEQWAHEASIVASSDWPLLEYRRQAFSQWKNSPLHKLKGRDNYLRGILRHVDECGATTSHNLPAVAGPKRKAGDWHRSIPRSGLEHHFGTGQLAVRDRLRNFQRVYDRPEHIIDNALLSTTVSKTDAHRELLRKASVSLGIATARDLADYYRMNMTEVAPRIDELLEEGALSRVQVDDWKDPAYLSVAAKIPRQIPGASLLSPFDPVVWFRPRAERVFGFEYRIEIYVPQAKRRWGYYVLPFRRGDKLVARVDLKADRKGGVLQVRRAHLEVGEIACETAAELATELLSIASWLGLDAVTVDAVSAFEKTLAASLKR